MPTVVKEFVRKINDLEDCEAILEYVFVLLRAIGVSWFSYHFTPIFESHTSKQTFIWARDFPYELQKLYIGADYRSIDPVPRLTMEHGPVLTWTRAARLGRDDRKASAYFDQLNALGVNNWASFALFGPHNRNGYAVLRFVEDPDEFEEGQLAEIQALLTSVHLQCCKNIDRREPAITLSKRESEVLRWVGAGKSVTDIATILELSPETVKTYTKRIYEKLETNDRVTATVRALKLGLVEL